MPMLALTVLSTYFAIAFGLRSWIQWRRTGSSGFNGISRTGGVADWIGGVLLIVAVAAAVLGPVAQLGGFVAPWPALTGPGAGAAGLVLSAAGMVGTLWSQLAMGDAWRIGVDASERTALVATGPFRLVRNPIYTSMVTGLGGIALLTPNVVSAAALLVLVVALELQVRRVEEPHLLRVHGAAYRSYAASTGRFLPSIGRLGTA